MYGRTPLRFRPHCGISRPLLCSFAEVAVGFAAGDELAFGEPAAFGDDAGAAEDDDGVIGFSPACISDGSFRNFISQSGSTRAPSLVSGGGREIGRAACEG